MSGRYQRTKQDNKPIDMHRKTMAQILGRPLLSTEYVHHKDENKWNNDPSNLEIMDPVTHGRHHHLRYPLTKICEVCGTTFTPHKTKRKRKKTCSRSCGAILANRNRATI